MISMRFRSHFNPRRVIRRTRKGSSRSLSRAAGAIRLTARRSIRPRGKSGRSSAPGQPPRTYYGKLRKSILYHVNRRDQSAVIGPAFPIAGHIGHTHEFGGRERRKKANWNLHVGGHGPIARQSARTGGERDARGRYQKRRSPLVVVRLKSPSQVRRARTVAAEYDQTVRSKPLANYPKRPFMEPALTKNIHILPRHWRGSIHK
jgi:hypothetical protein